MSSLLPAMQGAKVSNPIRNLLRLSIGALDSLRRRARAKPSHMGHTRFLFLTYSPALGASLHGTPMFEALKQAIPGCKIAVAASGMSYEVVRENPFADFVWPTPTPDTDLVGAVRALRKSMRSAVFEPDWVCFDYWNQRTRTVLLGALATGSRRCGFAINGELLDVALSYEPSLSIIDNNLKVLSALDLDIGRPEPRIFFSSADLEKCKQLLPGDPDRHRARAALIVRGTGTKPTAWYEQRFAEIGDFLRRELDCDVVFVGPPQDAPKIDDLRHLMKEPSINLAGKTKIGELAAVLASCDLGVGIDTGGMHVARAVGLPFVLIAAAFEPAHVWLPVNQPHVITIQKSDIGCRYCNKSSCATRECMDYIGTREVESAIHSILERYPPSLASRTLRVQRSLGGRAGKEPQTAGADLRTTATV